MSRWKPTRDEAQFIGEISAIDHGLAGIIRDQLQAGKSLASVRHALSISLKVAAIARGDPSPTPLKEG